MYSFNPRGENLRALEQNILKYRAFEMVMILFYVEEIKTIALRTIRATDSFWSGVEGKSERLPCGTKKLYKKLWELLVSESVLTEEEKSDIEAIIDYRNDIAHSIEQLVFDLNVDSLSRSYVEFKGSKYEYGVLERLKKYKEALYDRFSGEYVIEINMNYELFYQAERIYVAEMKKLEKKICRLLEIRKLENTKVESEINQLRKGMLDAIKPYHPENFKRNGQLTEKGVERLHELFFLGISNTAISYLMRISLNSIRKRQRSWVQQRA